MIMKVEWQEIEIKIDSEYSEKDAVFFVMLPLKFKFNDKMVLLRSLITNSVKSNEYLMTNAVNQL